MQAEVRVPMPRKWQRQYGKKGESTAAWLAAAKDRRSVMVCPDREGFPVFEGSDFSYAPESPGELGEFLFEGGRWLTVSDRHSLESVWKIFPPEFCQKVLAYNPASKALPPELEGFRWQRIGHEDSIRVTRKSQITQHAHLSNVMGLMPANFDRTPPGICAWAERFFSVLLAHGITDIGSMASRGLTGSGILDSINLLALPDLRENARQGKYRRDVLDLALQADKGGRTEAFSLGFHAQAWQYDYQSAYAACLKDLPCICFRCCTWSDSKEYQPSADYGFAVCEVVEPLSVVGIPAYRSKVSRHVDAGYGLTWPYGPYDVVLALPTMRLMQQQRRKFRIIKAFWGFCKEDSHRSFQETVSKVFRMTAENPDIAFSFKAARNAMIGSFRSIYGDNAGSHFNPIYSAHVKDVVRAAVTAVALRHQDSVIRISTDGLALSKPLPDSELGDQPGDLRLEGEPGESMTLLTDYFVDRPGKAPRWRQCLHDAPLDAAEFELSIETFNGLGVFANLPPDEAWQKLGKPEMASWQVPLGSGVRKAEPATVKDYLSGPIETDQVHIEDVQMGQQIAEWEGIFAELEGLFEQGDV